MLQVCIESIQTGSPCPLQTVMKRALVSHEDDQPSVFRTRREIFFQSWSLMYF